MSAFPYDAGVLSNNVQGRRARASMVVRFTTPNAICAFFK